MAKPNGLSSFFRSAVNSASKPRPPHEKPSRPSASGLFDELKLVEPTPGGATEKVKQEISSILYGSSSVAVPDSPRADGELSLENALGLPSVSNVLMQRQSFQRKENIRDRKGKWFFKSNQTDRFHHVIRTSTQVLGSKAIQVLEKLGRDTGEKEYNSLIKLCLDEAGASDNENVALGKVSDAIQYIKAMKEQGFQLKEGTYGPLLLYMIDKGMVEDFHFLCQLLKEDDPSSLPRLGYYEMQLYIRVNDEDKIEELCKCFANDDGCETIRLRENYLSALCDGDRKNDISQLMENVDITQFSSLDNLTSIIKSLGRLILESFAEKFLSALKEFDYGADKISTLIFAYASSIPKLAVEDVVSRFEDLHRELELKPSSKSYEMLINHCCELLKVHVALDVVDKMGKSGLTLSTSMLQLVLRACDESFEYNLVWQIYSLIWHHGLKPDTETFRIMISLCVKMKDFDGAYRMLKDLKKLNLTPVAGIYNVMMGGYFREKNMNGALMVLSQMEIGGVQPDSSTYSYLISNCDTEEKIVELYEQMKFSGIKQLKQVFMALINAYASCGQYEKAKQVLLDKCIPINNLNEIKSVLVSALASHGQMSDALGIYDDMKEAGCTLEPKAVTTLIEHLKYEGGLSRLLKLLEELNDHDLWVSGCYRVILYCIHNKHISSAVHLLRQLKDRYNSDELAMEVIFDEVFAQVPETEPLDLDIGLDLLQAIKIELGLVPSRKCLDFLLSACIKAGDLENSLLVWKEYPLAGLPYNVLSYLRMYQALLASGGLKKANTLLSEIPRDDPHVCVLIKACKEHYCGKMSASSTSSKKKKNK